MSAHGNGQAECSGGAGFMARARVTDRVRVRIKDKV